MLAGSDNGLQQQLQLGLRHITSPAVHSVGDFIFSIVLHAPRTSPYALLPPIGLWIRNLASVPKGDGNRILTSLDSLDGSTSSSGTQRIRVSALHAPADATDIAASHTQQDHRLPVSTACVSRSARRLLPIQQLLRAHFRILPE